MRTESHGLDRRHDRVTCSTKSCTCGRATADNVTRQRLELRYGAWLDFILRLASKYEASSSAEIISPRDRSETYPIGQLSQFFPIVQNDFSPVMSCEAKNTLFLKHRQGA
jgi:hypothetical protein